ncbi:hypothetical protein [Pseudomonas sp.]|uniref:hypothetical protein n=1 Tax=Pseudomonas sp. TaxID=306 RepID=UPI00299E3EEC|nr:hypothetical protein [Pseudomonas sp.]MDX1366876.1 hypothetical protein [Pseudomonas sp.]
MAIDFRRRCELAELLDGNPSLLQNHLENKMPEWLSRNHAELLQVRQASVEFGHWLSERPGEKTAQLSNALFVERLDGEISASNAALAIYRKHGWKEADAPQRSNHAPV